MKNAIRNGLLLGAAALLAATGAQAAEEKKLHVYNWSDYIAEDTISKFEEEFGIDVTYDVYDSNEVLEAKLLAGSTGYDVVVPSLTPFMARQIEAGVYRKIDKDKLSKYENLDDEILERVAEHDPGNRYGVPYMWGTTGFAYNIDMVEERMADAPTNSWDMLFDPDVVSNFADCGVTFLDAPAEVFPAAINYIGGDPATMDPKWIDKALEQLMKVRPHIKYFHSSQNINDLANGDICVAMGWSGDMFIAKDRAAAAGEGVEIRYVIPKEGAVMWTDMMGIPKDAPHPNNAHKFIDFILRPEIAADISNYVWYANANEAATPYVREEVKTNPAIYPSPEVMGNLFVPPVKPQDYARKRTRAFTKLKTGQ